MATAHPLKIGLDIDDVLIRTGEHTVKLYNEAHGASVTLDHWYNFDPEVWAAPDVGEAISRVRALTELDAFDDVNPVVGARVALEKLKADGHELLAITGRPENVRTQTLRILERYFPGLFTHDTVFFTDHYGGEDVRLSKTDIAKRLGLDYFVDDQVFHVNELNEAGIKTLLFSDNYLWNQDGVLPGTHVVSSWEEIEKHFDGLK